MEIDRSQFLDNIYELINNKRKKYGEYKKCEFHIHTPESKCYRFITPKDKLDSEDDLDSISEYEQMPLEKILEYGKELSFLTDDAYNIMINKIDDYKQEIPVKILNGNKVKYKSFKEYITYEMIAHKLYVENINVAVVSDHNTIAGYDKLLCAINEYCNRMDLHKKYKLKLFLGVEISCSDKNHLMVIVDLDKKMKLQKYLDDIIMGDNLGSYLDTRTIINGVSKLNAITYIAHANSSEFHGNDVYKRELLNSEGLNGLGIKDESQLKSLIDRTKRFKKDIEKTAFILEADSHSINEIGRKNCWIKFSTMDFNALKKAFINHRICISNQKPQKTNIQIKGLVVERGDRGFLGPSITESEDKYMVIDFSSDLNCIIGGRGTGKSTILNIIEVIYTQETNDLEILNFISQHKRIYSLFIIDNEEYILDFLPQVYSKGNYNLYPEVSRCSYYEEDGVYKLNSYWYTLFKISKIANKNKYIEIKGDNISEILKDVFKRGYNINKLVNKINNNEISNYIREVMINNVNYTEINLYINKIKSIKSNSIIKEIRENLDDIIEMINIRKREFDLKVKEFNDKNKNIIEIRYTPINNSNEFFNDFLNILSKNRLNDSTSKYSSPQKYDELNRSICRTYLTWGDLQKYLSDATEKWSYFEVLKMILNSKLHLMNKEMPLINYEGIEEGYKTIETGFEHINSNKIKEVNKEIIKKFSSNKMLLRDSIIKCFNVLDNFEIFFNINFKEDVATLPNDLKNIKTLSSGQKVAALLTFVINFGLITNDNTPLIIDQPEDNLDNTYIYKTLVESLKSIKNKRQVIIVTHSSTIVINADAEKVIVLKSENNKGWIEKHGYPSEKTVTNHILNYLEGGRDSFSHKYNMYKTILNI